MNKLILFLGLLFFIPMANALNTMILSANGHTIPVILSNTKAAQALSAMMKEKAVTVVMSDYGGFEKVGAFSKALPTDNRHITTQTGDIMLYEGRYMVIFYGTHEWSYTPLGKIKGLSGAEIRQLLKGNQLEVTLAIPHS